jgi:hypothetical protein
MSIKELIKAELEYLSDEDLAELYELVKSRSQREKDDHDELGALLERCKINTGISDLAEQHDH